MEVGSVLARWSEPQVQEDASAGHLPPLLPAGILLRTTGVKAGGLSLSYLSNGD